MSKGEEEWVNGQQHKNRRAALTRHKMSARQTGVQNQHGRHLHGMCNTDAHADVQRTQQHKQAGSKGKLAGTVMQGSAVGLRCVGSPQCVGAASSPGLAER